MRTTLNELYDKIKLNRNDGKDCPSYAKCFASCKIEKRNLMPPTGAYAGEDYQDNSILFIGINTNQGSSDSSQFYSTYNWISKDDSYIAGTIHRIIKKVIGNPEMDPKETRRYFSFTNAIKCSVDKIAGKPTISMSSNCLYFHKYLFKELQVLKPRVIFTLGSFPFDAIKSEFIDTVEFVDDDFREWLYTIKLENKDILVIGLYNPGQGYRTPRSIFKKIREGKQIKDKWKIFISDDFKKADDLAQALERKYPIENRIDKANPFYDAIFDKLISVAKESDYEF